MGRRVAHRTASALRVRLGLALAIVLAAGTTNGPGVTALTRPTPGQPRDAAATTQADPIGDLAASLDYDATRIFRFVADEIRYEPYAGILRGARGTLAARAGNSDDKALLLAALLDASLLRYRFVRGPLDDTAVATLLDSMTTDVEGARRDAAEPLLAGVEALAETDAPDSSPTGGPLASQPQGEREEQEAEAALATQADTRFQEAATRLGSTVGMVEDALDRAGIALPRQALALPPSEVADHAWVELQVGSTWQDLDPTLAATPSGATLAPARETLAQLPDDLRYRVRFDVLVERVQGDQLVTDGTLEYEGFADELAGTPVTFSHVTPSGLKVLGITIGTLLGDGWVDYRPTLDLGDRTIVADEAVGFPVPGRGSDPFSDPASPSGGPAGPVEGEATAEWLEVRVTPPGGEPAVARRVVFDRLPVAVRHGGTPTPDAVGPIALADLDDDGLPDYPPLLGLEAFAVATGPTSAGPMTGTEDEGLGTLALAYHIVRDAIDAQLAIDAGARTFLDAPNIVSVAVDIAPSARTADLRGSVRMGFDVWHRSHGVLPLRGPSATTGEAQLIAGITDHLAERFALETLIGRRGSAPGTIGVGEVFDAAAADGLPTWVLHGSVPDALPYVPQANQAITAAVMAGDVVIVPAAPVIVDGASRIGWWAIDPATGRTTDAMDDGSGTAMTEEGVIIRTRLGAVRCYGALGAVAAREIAWVAAKYLWASRLGSIPTFRFWRDTGMQGTRCFAV